MRDIRVALRHFEGLRKNPARGLECRVSDTGKHSLRFWGLPRCRWPVPAVDLDEALAERVLRSIIPCIITASSLLVVEEYVGN